MAYRVTITNIKTNPDSPSFSDWVDSLAGSDILDARYPEYTGRTPSDIVSTTVAEKIENPAAGFISVENTETTYTTVWESQQAYEDAMEAGRITTPHNTTPLSGTISLSTTSPTVVGVGTAFLTDAEVGGYIHITVETTDSNNSVVAHDTTVGIIQSIESDTSLTLEDNSTNTAQDIGYHTEPKMSAFTFLQERYNSLYPVTSTIETANV